MAGDRSVTKCCHLPWGLRSHLPGCRGAGAQLPCGAAWGGGQPPPPARQAARVSWVGARRVRQHSVLCPSTLCAPRPPCHSQLVLGSGSFVLQDERGTAAVPLLPPSPRGAKGSAVSAPGAGCLLATQGTQMQNPNTPQSPNTRPVAHVGTAGTPLLQVHGVAAGHRGAGRRQGNKGQAGTGRALQEAAQRSPLSQRHPVGAGGRAAEGGAGCWDEPVPGCAATGLSWPCPLQPLPAPEGCKHRICQLKAPLGAWSRPAATVHPVLAEQGWRSVCARCTPAGTAPSGPHSVLPRHTARPTALQPSIPDSTARRHLRPQGAAWNRWDTVPLRPRAKSVSQPGITAGTRPSQGVQVQQQHCREHLASQPGSGTLGLTLVVRGDGRGWAVPGGARTERAGALCALRLSLEC